MTIKCNWLRKQYLNKQTSTKEKMYDEELPCLATEVFVCVKLAVDFVQYEFVLKGWNIYCVTFHVIVKIGYKKIGEFQNLIAKWLGCNAL